MDEGLLFWFILIAVAIAQAIGQRKKKPGSGGAARKAPGRPPDADSASRTTAPRTAPLPQPGPRPLPPPSSTPVEASSGNDGSRTEADSSEGLVPADVWEEILGLARGGPPKGRVESPQEENTGFTPAPAAEPAPAPVPAPAPKPRKGLKARADKPPVRGSTSTPRPLRTREDQPAREKWGDGGATVTARNRLFRDGSPEELRKAIILKEVLGPPVSLREE